MIYLKILLTIKLVAMVAGIDYLVENRQQILLSWILMVMVILDLIALVVICST